MYQNMFQNQLELIRKTGLQEKAYTISDADALKQPLIDVILNNLMYFQNPLRANIQRKKWPGGKYTKREATQGSKTAAYTATGVAFAESKTTRAKVDNPYKTMGTTMTIAQDQLDDGIPWLDVWMEELQLGIDVFRDIEDYHMTVGECDATDPDGLYNQITSGQTVLNCASDGGDAIDLVRLDKCIDTVKGVGIAANMLLMNLPMRRELQYEMGQSQQWMNIVKVDGGFLLMSYNGVPIFITTNIPNTQNFNGTCNDSETEGSETMIIALDKNFFNVFYNREVYMEPLGLLSSQYKSADLRFRGVPVLKNTNKASMLLGITTPNDW